MVGQAGLQLFACVVSALAVPCAAQSAHPPHPAQPTDPVRLGTISFPTSALPPAQAEFLRGVLYLHSFEYSNAQKAFRQAQALEPNFAMAYWGEAMTHTHPVWNEQDLGSARAALERLGPISEARRAKTPTPREQAYLGAVETLYGDGSKARRDTLYAAAMERVVHEFPGDPEAKIFYALALLGLNQGVRDTTTYLRAAQFADTVFRAFPDHPGAAHFLIHSYDDPVHAPRGLEAARAYARIAPDAAHAQHMTTHIFLAMGMWEDVVAQNRIAVGLTAEIPGHYTSWLVYGLIQQGKYEAAQAMLQQLRSNMRSDAPRGQHTYLAEMRAHFLLHSEDWNNPVAGWRLDRDRMLPLGRLIDTYVDGAIAYRRRDAMALSAAASAVAQHAETIRMERGPTDPTTFSARVMARELGAMLLVLGGSREEAIGALREAAALEDAMPMEFGPPSIVDPSHEVLAALLLEVQPSQAMSSYRRALELAPGRSRALAGLVRAAVAAGDKPAAEVALARVDANWRDADPRIRELLIALRSLVTRMP